MASLITSFQIDSLIPNLHYLVAATPAKYSSTPKIPIQVKILGTSTGEPAGQHRSGQAGQVSCLHPPCLPCCDRWLGMQRQLRLVARATGSGQRNVIWQHDKAQLSVKKVIPKAIRGSIIITSQDNQSRRLIDGGCEELQVSMMTPLEARGLLQHLELEIYSTLLNICQRCDMVAKKLGYLALAVDLAGVYIGNDSDREAAFKQYLTDYDKYQDALFRDNDSRGLSATDKTV